jgi:rhodanese-related sulfurtransferase
MSKKSSSSKSQKSASSKSEQRGVKPVVWIIGLVVILLLIAASSALLLGPKTSATPAHPDEISVQEAHQKYEQGILLVDVRTPEEWAEYHAPNTTLIPLDELENRLNELPKDQEIVVICRSGNRSQQGRDILRNAGFAQTSSMAGGLKEWRAVGYPTVEGP